MTASLIKWPENIAVDPFQIEKICGEDEKDKREPLDVSHFDDRRDGPERRDFLAQQQYIQIIQ